MSMDNDIRWNLTWEEFEKLFSDKWTRDPKIEAMYTIPLELKESKENVSKLQNDMNI
jgi:hypothetical protein